MPIRTHVDIEVVAVGDSNCAGSRTNSRNVAVVADVVICCSSSRGIRRLALRCACSSLVRMHGCIKMRVKCVCLTWTGMCSERQCCAPIYTPQHRHHEALALVLLLQLHAVVLQELLAGTIACFQYLQPTIYLFVPRCNCIGLFLRGCNLSNLQVVFPHEESLLHLTLGEEQHTHAAKMSPMVNGMYLETNP